MAGTDETKCEHLHLGLLARVLPTVCMLLFAVIRETATVHMHAHVCSPMRGRPAVPSGCCVSCNFSSLRLGL